MRLYWNRGALRLYMELFCIIPQTGMNRVYRTKQNFQFHLYSFFSSYYIV